MKTQNKFDEAKRFEKICKEKRKHLPPPTAAAPVGAAPPHEKKRSKKKSGGGFNLGSIFKAPKQRSRPRPAPSPEPVARPSRPAPAVVPASMPAPAPAPTPAPAPAAPAPMPGAAASAPARVDLGVYGVRLGEAITLPPCPAESTLTTPPPFACVARDARSLKLAQSFRTVSGRALPSGTADVPVRLPAAKCADWLAAGRTGCTVFFTTKDGKAASALVPAGGPTAEASVEPGLTQKYHANATADSIGSCPLRVWSLSGLRVAYAPNGGRCSDGSATPNLGFIEFSTDAYVRETAATNPKSEPLL